MSSVSRVKMAVGPGGDYIVRRWLISMKLLSYNWRIRRLGPTPSCECEQKFYEVQLCTNTSVLHVIWRSNSHFFCNVNSMIPRVIYQIGTRTALYYKEWITLNLIRLLLYGDNECERAISRTEWYQNKRSIQAPRVGAMRAMYADLSFCTLRGIYADWCIPYKDWQHYVSQCIHGSERIFLIWIHNFCSFSSVYTIFSKQNRESHTQEIENCNKFGKCCKSTQIHQVTCPRAYFNWLYKQENDAVKIKVWVWMSALWTSKTKLFGTFTGAKIPSMRYNSLEPHFAELQGTRIVKFWPEDWKQSLQI